MSQPRFSQIPAGAGFYAWIILLAGFIAAALGAVYYMEHSGHWVTGMSNQVIWGTPHLFAIFLIVAASGALNVASIASVFNKTMYKPLAPLSAILAVALLIGGLVVLVLDLGRPDRLIVAMTHFNFKSIFTWNIFLYSGFAAIVLIYLWTMLEKRMNRYSQRAGLVAFLWRLILTTGTGSIFGFLVAREGYDAALLAPMFVILSFAWGLAVYMLVLMISCRIHDRELGNLVILRLRSLLAIFVAATLYFSLVYHVTNLYATEHHSFEAFVLRDGGVYTAMFWLGQIVLGTLLPLGLLFHPSTQRVPLWIATAAGLVIVGAFATLYVIIIGGQSFPIDIFTGYTVSSSFDDGIIADYAPSLPELILGIGGVAIGLMLVSISMAALRLLPESLSDEVMQPLVAKEVVAD